MSFIGWLDHSEEEQLQVRKLLRLFEEKGTFDDLGIGTVRDAISNRLFPGTSVIQTRARYFLFIPWIFHRAEQRNRHHVVKSAELMERKLIGALQQSDDQEGLIGRQAGKDIRTLPSAIYWTGLAAYGIFLQPGLTRSQYDRAVRRVSPTVETEDELAERSASYWHRGLPDAPDGFFDFAAADFQLSRDEALWLSERVLSTEPLRGPNLLGSYVARLRKDPAVPAGMFWDEPLPGDVTEDLRSLVHHARQFSVAVEGAALLYNLMLTEERDTEGDAEQAERLRRRLQGWAADGTAVDLPAWSKDLAAFWSVVTSHSRVPPQTRAFIEQWCSLLHQRPLDEFADDDAARLLIRARELDHKKTQARFGNPARLRDWNGESGLNTLAFRWSQVRRFLRDLSGGLHKEKEQSEVVNAAH